MHELARVGDWERPQRVDFAIASGARVGASSSATSSAEGKGLAEGTSAADEPTIAVAAGNGMWAAVSADGSLLVCVFPCMRLSRLRLVADDGADADSLSAAATEFRSVAVGNVSLYAVTRDGAVYAAALASTSTQADEAAALLGRPTAGSVYMSRCGGDDGARDTLKGAIVPRLGPLRRVCGSIASRHVAHVAAASRGIVAITSDGGLHSWGESTPLPTAAWPPARPAPMEMAKEAVSSGQERPHFAASAALSTTHLLVLTSSGIVLSRAIPAQIGRGPPELAALGRPSAAEGGADAFTLTPIVDATQRKKRLPLKRYPLPPLASGVSAVAAGSSFSLAILAGGSRRGQLLYWGGQPQEGAQPTTEDGAATAAGDTTRRRSRREHGGRRRGGASLPGDMPSPLHSWCGGGRKWASMRFLLIGASGTRAVALATDGSLYSWVHGVDARPTLMASSASSAIAVSPSMVLLLVPAFDHQPTAVSAYSAPVHGRGSGDRHGTLLVQPATLPRPIAVRSDNVGVTSVATARFDALAASVNSFDSGMRSTCWRDEPHVPPPQAKAATSQQNARGAASQQTSQACPLKRPSDCTDWPRASSASATLKDGPASLSPDATDRSMGCLPAALILGARGCGSSLLDRLLSIHPHVTSAPPGMNPWWAYTQLGNFTRDARMYARAVHALPTPSNALG